MSLPLAIALFLCSFLLQAQQQSQSDEPAWKTKPTAEWNETEAKQLLSDSPWVKSATPAMIQTQKAPRQSGGGRSGMGGMGGRRMGGIGGIGGIGGGGYPGGNYPRNSGGNSGSGQPRQNQSQAPTLAVRWESAMPVRTAELKTHDIDAPTIEDKYYAIAVYGIPTHMLPGEAKKLSDQLKKKATIKRDGKKDLKPASVQVIDRPDGPLVVYLFPRSTEITKGDHRAEFNAEMNKMSVRTAFFLEDMVLRGKLEL